jgi:hypothetical protein
MTSIPLVVLFGFADYCLSVYVLFTVGPWPALVTSAMLAGVFLCLFDVRRRENRVD